MVAQLQTYYLFDVQALVDAASGTMRGFNDSSKIWLTIGARWSTPNSNKKLLKAVF